MQYELLTQKLNKMDNEKILLDALNTFGNFTSVEQEFNYNQLEVIYEAMNQVLHIADVVGRSEQLVCDVCGSTDIMEAPHMGRNCNRCHPL